MALWLSSSLWLSIAAWALLDRQITSVESAAVSSSKICDTEECVQLADAFIKSMNQSVDPCVNFYEYACGNWLAHNPVPEYIPESSWTAPQRFQDLALRRLGGLLESEPSSTDILPIQQMKKIYKSCMNASAEIETILEVFRKANGWPMIMNNGAWNGSAMRWQEVDHYYRNLMGHSTFWNVEMRNSSSGRAVLVIQPPELLDFLDPLEWNRHRSTMKNLTQLFIEENHARISIEQFEKDLDDMLEFEARLNSLKFTQRSLTVSYRNASAFLKYWDPNGGTNYAQGRVGWNTVLGRYLNAANLSTFDETPIFLSNIVYFYALSSLLELTDERTIVNFVHWSALDDLVGYLPDQILKMRIPQSPITNMKRRQPRWLQCIFTQDTATIRLFGKELSGDRAKIDTMITNIKRSFESQSAKSNWLSTEAKEAIKEKLHRMKYLIAYPEHFNNDTKLIDYYEGLTVGDNYLENVLSLEKTYEINVIKFWGRAMEDKPWSKAPLKVNAFNDRNANTLIVPVADFQSPLFRGVVPAYVEYGTIGWTLAHEFGHSVDTKGILFGPTPNTTLFDANMTALFYERVKCFVDAAEKTAKGSGNLTVAENLADWLGMETAFNAYKELKNKAYPNGELKLPHFEAMSDEKMFFISFAQEQCTASTEWYKGSTYSSESSRIMMTLSNTVAFAETFNCPKNATMNPEEKCNMWIKPN